MNKAEYQTYLTEMRSYYSDVMEDQPPVLNGIMIPWQMIFSHQFSVEEMFVYGMALSFISRAIKAKDHNWIDQHGNYFCYLTIERLHFETGLTDKTITKILKSLEQKRLIKRQRQFNQPTRIYVAKTVWDKNTNPNTCYKVDVDDYFRDCYVNSLERKNAVSKEEICERQNKQARKSKDTKYRTKKTLEEGAVSNYAEKLKRGDTDDLIIDKGTPFIKPKQKWANE